MIARRIAPNAASVRASGAMSGFFAALAIAFALWLSQPAAAQLRVVNYNIAQLRGDADALMDVFAALHEDDKTGFAVPVSVFLFQEVRSMDLPILQSLLNDSAPPGVGYVAGTYTNNNEDNFAGAQAMFFRAGMMLEVASEHMDIYTGAGRYTDRWQLRIVGYDSALARFYAYSSHLKASDSMADANERLFGVQQIRNNAAGLGAGTYIIYAGDYNFYHNSEPGYLWWFSPGVGQAIDPLGTGSWSGPVHAIKHTQSPRQISAGGLVGGGMDDRFDFQLATSKFQDGMGFSRIAGTYRAFGNDGMKYDAAINNGNNFYYPDDIPRSNALADALHDASDHIPVVVDYQIPARLSATLSPMNFGTVIQGAELDITYNVTNSVSSAFVVTPIGADVLQFTATGSGAISGMASDSAEALAGPTSGALTLTATDVGPASGTITFTSPNEAVQIFTPSLTTNGTVIAPSQPSFADDEVADALLIEIDIEPDIGMYVIDVPVHNFGYGAMQARMDIDAVTGLGGPGDPLEFLSGLESNIEVSPATLEFAFDTSAPLGVHENLLTVHTSDEDLPGETSSQLALTLVVGLGETAMCPADLDGSGSVNVFDMLELLAAWGTCPDPEDCPADLDGNGAVNVFDMLELLAAWGPCPR